MVWTMKYQEAIISGRKPAGTNAQDVTCPKVLISIYSTNPLPCFQNIPNDTWHQDGNVGKATEKPAYPVPRNVLLI